MLEQLRLLTSQDKQALLLSAKEVDAPAGTALVREGAAQPGLIMLVEGRASVRIAEGGERRTVAHIGPGECIGEISLLSGQTTTANVTLDVPGRYLCIPPERLKAVLDADPAMTGRFYGSLALIVAERLAQRNRAEGGPDPLGFVDRIAASWTKRGAEAQRGGHLGLIGDSPVMRELYAAIDRVAAGDWTVLIRGETGSGKELVARAVHEASKRRGGPFVAVNCAGLTDTLLSSQLFGHIRGAFTGATRDQPGLFEAASGGTIFLDEIGDISLATQRSLLRVLQEREIIRVGEAQTRKVDTRVLAATHRDLEAMTRTGDFREDLLYRIRIARIAVPPLRARLSDVPTLAAGFLKDPRVTGAKTVRGIAPAALDRLQHYTWPGNVRELKAALEHAVIHTSREILCVDDLPPELLGQPIRATSSAPAVGAAVGVATLQRAGLVGVARSGNDRAAIIEALRLARGNRSEAARLLGIGRATLYRWLKTHAIDVNALAFSE